MIMMGLMAETALYNLSAKMDSFKVERGYKKICKRMEKEEKKKGLKDKKNVTESVEQKQETTSQKKPEEKETVIEKTVNIETTKPIDVSTIKETAESIASEIEKSINDINKEKKEEIKSKENPVEDKEIKTSEKQTEDDSVKKLKNIFNAFMEFPSEERRFKIYDAVVKNGDAVLESINNKDKNNVALFNVMLKNILGVNPESVDMDKFDEVAELYPEFEKDFMESVNRALEFISSENESKKINVEETEDDVVDNTDDPAIEQDKVDIEKSVIEESKEQVHLKMPIDFSEDEEKKENSNNKKNYGNHRKKR